MLSNLFTKFFKTSLIALVGNLLVAFLNGLATHTPTNLDTIAGYAYPLLVSAVTGALFAVKRWIQWNPAKR